MDHNTVPGSADVETRFENALELHQQGQTEAARDIYRGVLAVAPTHFGALYASGLIALQAGEAAEALAMLDSAVLQNPADAAAHYNKGAALHALARYEEAAASFIEAVRRDPGFYDAHASLGRVLHHLGHFEAAQQSYAKALAVTPTAELYHERALILHALRRSDEALVSMDAALRLKPGELIDAAHEGEQPAENGLHHGFDEHAAHVGARHASRHGGPVEMQEIINPGGGELDPAKLRRRGQEILGKRAEHDLGGEEGLPIGR